MRRENVADITTLHFTTASNLMKLPDPLVVVIF